MWTVVYMAQEKRQAMRLCYSLAELGVIYKLRPVGKDCAEKDVGYEVLVPAAEVEKAHDIIIDVDF